MKGTGSNADEAIRHLMEEYIEAYYNSDVKNYIRVDEFDEYGCIDKDREYDTF